ncbi:cellulose biosynthesis protein BcsO [Shimwellia blattae]|nr:cellulose biosynthesis protein BcsO [Shimwellia blattae]
MSSNYDDLQRFRDKTQTNGIPFQEIATPKARSTRSDWNMINQVLAGEQENSPFPATVNTSRAAPQTVAPGMFTLASAPAIGGEPVAARKEPQPPARPAPVTPMGEVSAAEPSTLLKAMADIPVPAQPMAPVSAGDAGQITPAHSMPTAAATLNVRIVVTPSEK